MLLVFSLLVNGREIGVAGNGAEGAGAPEAELPAWRSCGLQEGIFRAGQDGGKACRIWVEMS